MDNVSKALIMAGGILIAVMVVSLAMYLLAGARGFASAANEQAELSAIESFNRYYLSFDSEIKGIDAINIYNKAIDDTNRHNALHPVQIAGDIVDEVSRLEAETGIAYMKQLEEEGKTYSYQVSYDSDGYINLITIDKNF